MATPWGNKQAPSTLPSPNWRGVGVRCKKRNPQHVLKNVLRVYLYFVIIFVTLQKFNKNIINFSFFIN
jgi:hypothetical protein